MKVVCIEGSPRKGSNSRILLEQVMRGAEAAGAETTLITPWRLEMQPCLACDGCYGTGRCTIEDDFQAAYDLIVGAAGMVLATPVYFGAVSAQAKILIDRCECLWALRYLLENKLPPSGQPRLGVLIATAGREEEIMFAGPRITFDFLMGSCQGQIYAELLYGGLDERRAVRNNHEAMDRAFKVGHSLVLKLQDDRGER